jgi:ribosomal protein L34E
MELEYGSLVVNKRGIIGRISGHPTPQGEVVVMRAREHYPISYCKLAELRLATLDDARKDYARTTNKASKRTIKFWTLQMIEKQNAQNAQNAQQEMEA